jgi:tetratricopeptide (TPR) repeat protein
MKTITAIITAMVIMACAAIQNGAYAQLSYKEKANALISNYEFAKAIALYEESFKTQAPSNEDLRNITYCYLQTNNTKSAKEWIAKLALIENPSPKDVLQYAHLLKTEAEYDEAIAQYKRYQKLSPDDKNTTMWIESCNLAKQWMNNPTYFQVTNLQELNSENSDFGMMPLKKGFVFTSDRKSKDIANTNEIYGWTGNPYLKLYHIPDGTKLTEFGPISSLNGEYHNGPSTYLAKTNQIYFTRTKMVKVTKKNLNNDPTSWIENVWTPEYENRLEMYTATAVTDNTDWECHVDFPYNKPEEYSVGHPALSPDGKILYFVSDMPGGQGQTDIYYCVKNASGKWSSPINAGKTINTSGKELFPYVDKNGVLYFSSDGHLGMGGLDIFKTTGNKNKWSVPENLKSPVNSSKDDFSVTFDESNTIGYLSSNRPGGKGNDDIYRFEYAPPTDLTLVVTVKEMDKNSVIKPLEGVNLKITNSTNSALSTTSQYIDGRFISGIKCNNSYIIMASKEGYFAKSEKINTKCTTYHDTVFVEMVLVKLEVDVPIVLKNIYYDFDKSFIRDDAKPDLDKLVQIMKDNPDIIVELGSHTDSRGSDQYNIVLSDRRAKAAVNYIISNGISKNRITAKGYGETMLLNECKNDVNCSEEAHQLNRRTEFKVTGFIKGKNKVIKSGL